ncbi:hypothetical protein [Halostagnicola sp. A56]|uniref:hypothetical protein n=1 Tax=Halostagnicola sp. A56 TaxID=1495067 RepID=UPI000678C4E7|nr:hypothetical protein [Halostagnicola sp. A56]
MMGEYVGQTISLGGTVIETDPLVIEVEHEYGTDEYRIQNAPNAETGQHLQVFATVHSDNILEVHNATIRDSWERIYLYVISLIGTLWVVTRAFNHWRIDTEAVGVVPRQDGDHDA